MAKIPKIDAKTSSIAMQRLASMARKGEEPELVEYFRYLDKLIASHIPRNLSWVWQENQRIKQKVKELEKIYNSSTEWADVGEKILEVIEICNETTI